MDLLNIAWGRGQDRFLQSPNKIEAARTKDVHEVRIDQKIEIGIELEDAIINQFSASL